MAGLGFEVEFDDREILKAFQDLRDNAGSTDEALEDIGALFSDITSNSFDTSTDPYGQAWPKLSDVTIARRRGTRSQILVDTGELKSSFNPQVEGQELLFGTTDPKAPTHQFGVKMGQYGRYSQVSRYRNFAEDDFRRYAGTKKGFPIPWGDIPARRMLPLDGLPEDTEVKVISIIVRHLLPNK